MQHEKEKSVIEKFEVVVFEDKNGTRFIYCDDACASISSPLKGDKIIAKFSNLDSERLNFLERTFHIDATGDDPVYAAFVPMFSETAWSLRQAIDEALAAEWLK